ncbi:MAG: putative Ig domain-containing protein, partial [Staphylococcus epidermidis]|nr:putative Ig domain-containing protein [Staphylococcus epidermidis]
MGKVSTWRPVRAIVAAGMASIPFTIVGSAFLVLSVIPQAFNLQFIVDLWANSFDKIQALYLLAYKCTMGILSLYFAIVIGYEYTKIYVEEEGLNLNPLNGGLLAVFAYFLTIPELTYSKGVISAVTGKETIKITSIDKGDNVSPAITISVIDKTPPAVKAISNKTQKVNTEIEPIKIEATDNSGQAVTNKVEGLPAGMTFDEATNTISGTPSEVGSYDITVTTTDENGNSETTTFTIDVEDTTKPTVESVADQTQEVNTEIEPIKIEATDNSGRAVTNKVDGLPDGVTFDEATNTISGTPSEVGSYDITVTTTDESGNVTETIFT